MCGCAHIPVLSDEGYTALKRHLGHAPAPKPTIPPTYKEFDPASPMVSYHDKGDCGPRGNDAKADLDSCGDAGYSKVVEVKFQSWDEIAAVVEGCIYWSYTVYKCNGDDKKETIMIRDEPCPLKYVIKSDDEGHDCVKGAPHFDREGSVCGMDNTPRESYCTYDLGDAFNCARCAAKQEVVIKSKPCPLAKVVIATQNAHDCIKDAPHFDKEGDVCGSDGTPEESYCSYDLGDSLNCARCAVGKDGRAPDFDGDFAKFLEYCQTLEDCTVCGGKSVNNKRCRYKKKANQVKCKKLKAEVCEAVGCTPKEKKGVFSKCSGKSNLE